VKKGKRQQDFRAKEKGYLQAAGVEDKNTLTTFRRMTDSGDLNKIINSRKPKRKYEPNWRAGVWEEPIEGMPGGRRIKGPGRPKPRELTLGLSL